VRCGVYWEGFCEWGFFQALARIAQQFGTLDKRRLLDLNHECQGQGQSDQADRDSGDQVMHEPI